jgi:hypothetical protein
MYWLLILFVLYHDLRDRIRREPDQRNRIRREPDRRTNQPCGTIQIVPQKSEPRVIYSSEFNFSKVFTGIPIWIGGGSGFIGSFPPQKNIRILTRDVSEIDGVVVVGWNLDERVDMSTILSWFSKFRSHHTVIIVANPLTLPEIQEVLRRG